MTIVTAAVVVNNDKVLIAQRQIGCHMEYKWEFPGGKLEKGETPEQCLKRELKEELDMEIEPVDIYKVVNFKHQDREMMLLVYLSKLIKGEGTPIECNDFKWVSKNELDGFEFTPADIPVVDKLKEDNLLN